MAVPNLSEEQKFQLDKLRRRLEMTPQAFLPEEKRRFYQSLDTLEGRNAESGSAEQDGVALQVLLQDLKMMAVRLGKNHGLYKDVLDALKSLAPEMVAEAERLAENEELRRNEEIRQRADDAQQRFEDHFPWLKEKEPEAKTEEPVKEEEKGFFAYSFDSLQTATDRAELAAYIQQKIEGNLTHDAVVRSREDFRERALSRIEEEMKKEKPDETMCRRLHARESLLQAGWNPDDMEMVDAFLSVVDHMPLGEVREEGEIVLTEMISRKVESWEERQIMFDGMSRYLEAAAVRLYPDGNVSPSFAEATAKLLNYATKIVSREEYPDDPQFEESKEKEQERLAGAARAAVDYVMGAQDYEGLRMKRTLSISQRGPRQTAPAREEVKDASPDAETASEKLPKGVAICSLEEAARRDEGKGLAPRNTGCLILDFAPDKKDREGYLDAASGEFYEMERLSELPKGIYFGDGENVFRLTSISELNDLMNTIHHGVNKEQTLAEERIRRNAKQWFVDNRLDLSYRDEKEREQVLAKTRRAEERLLSAQTEKYGMRELQQAILHYQEAKQRGDSADEIGRRENELIRELREYMERIPEKIGRTTCLNLEFACDLLCGIQRENNFRKKMRRYDAEPKTEEKKYPWELDDLLKTQEMVGENSSELQRSLAEIEKIGKVKEYHTDAFVRMERALKECIGLSAKNSIREMTGAYLELRMATIAYGKEQGWDGMEAIGGAKDEKERTMIAEVQKLSRSGRVMAERLLDRSAKITDKSMTMGELLLRKIEEDDLRREMETKKEMQKEQQREKNVQEKLSPSDLQLQAENKSTGKSFLKL